MTPDTILTLGDFAFSRFEIPERLPFGGEQRLAVHELVGGVRVVDAMGPSDAPIAWSGLFKGENALLRAQYLDGLRRAGAALPLKWGFFDYTVLIQSFNPDYERFYQIPYRISCLVVQDNLNPITTIWDAGADDLLGQDQDTCNTLVTSIGDASLSTSMGSLNTAIDAVPSFASATLSTVGSVLQPLAAVQARVGVLIESVNGTVAGVTTVGGVLPNTPVSQTALGLQGQVNAMVQLPTLLNLRNVLGRMGTNLETITSAPLSVTQAGGNLYQVAQQQFGDATQWTTIARANKLTDPVLQGVNTLRIPKVGDSSGGVLNG